MVGGDEHQRVLEFALALQKIEDATQVGVEMLDLQCIVEQVGAYNLIVGKIARHFVDIA